MNCYLHRISQNEEELLLLSPFDSESLAAMGMNEDFFIGSLIEPIHGVVKDNIRYNPGFLVLLHEAVRDAMAGSEEVKSEAAGQLNGFVFIVDQRSPEGTEVVKEDIIGIFVVHEKTTDASRYRPNPDYRMIGAHGFCRLPAEADALLMERLSALKK